jgi:uncharacterized membrane protein
MPAMSRTRLRTRRGLPAAIGLGIAGGMRTFVPAATIALRDRRPQSRLLRTTIVLASAGELAADKLPSIPSRTEPASLAARFAGSGAVGWNCAGPIGGLLAGATALGSAFLTHRVRSDAGRQTGLPDPAIAVAEDALALLIACVATRRTLAPPTSPATAPSKPAAAANPPAPTGPPPAPTAPPPTGPPPPRPDATAKSPASRRARRRGAPPRRRRCRRCRRSRG